MRRLTACAIVPAAKAGVVAKVQLRVIGEGIRAGKTEPGVSPGGVREHGGINTGPFVKLEGDLRRIIIARGFISERTYETRTLRRVPVELIEGWVVGAKEEEPVLQVCAGNVSAEFCGSIILGKCHQASTQVHALEVIVRVAPRRAHATWCKKGRQGAVIRGSTRFGYDLDDAAVAVTILRFEVTRLDLNLLDECEVDASTERTIDRAVYADAAVPGIGDIYAVSNILIFQTAGATDRWVSCAGTSAISDTGGGVKQAAYAPGHWHLAIEARGEVGTQRRGAGVNGGCRGIHLNSLGDRAGL